MNCAKPLDPSDKFCSYCGHKVMPPQPQHAQVTSDIATTNFGKFADRYSGMSNGDLIRLSAELSQLTEAAQKALISEIAKRASKDSSPILEQTDLGASPVNQTQAERAPDWEYEKMSDEELQQLCTAYQKLHQPISDSLRSELDLRASRRAQADSTPSPTPTQIVPIVQAAESVQATPAVAQVHEGFTPQKGRSAPYGKFVVQLLLFCLCASVCVFAIFDAMARDTTAFTVEALSALLAVAFGWLGWTSWKSVLEIESRSELKSRRRARKALVTSVIFILLYLGLAALLGSVIGQNRAEAVQFSSDIERQKQLADRITKARGAISNSIASYVAMYEAIEADVKTYSSALFSLREELGKYDTKFPAQHEATHKYMATIEKEIRRSDLLIKQIAAAKQIGSLYEYQQGAAWQSEMVPLLKEEDALDQSK